LLMIIDTPALSTPSPLAVLFAVKGANVVILDRDKDRAQHTQQAVEAQDRRSTIVVADVTDAAQVDAVFAELGARWDGKLNALINTVGPGAVGNFEDLTDDEQSAILDQLEDVVASIDPAALRVEILQLTRLIDDARRLELLLGLGQAYVRGGDRPLAWSPLREAAELAIRRGDAESLARAAVAAARRYVQQPGVVDEELLGLLDRALEMTAPQRSTVRVRLLARLCGALYYSDRRERMAAASAEATEIASELDDPAARALAAAARRRTFWSPSRLDQRLSDSAELLRFAREADDMELTLQGHAWLVVDLLEHGDSQAVDAQIEAFTEGAERLRQPLYLWQAAVWRGMRALLEGHLEEADKLAAQALAIGARAEPVTARQYYGVQLIAIRRDQGRMGELEEAVRQVSEQYQDLSLIPIRRCRRSTLCRSRLSPYH